MAEQEEILDSKILENLSESYKTNGYAVIENFLNDAEVEALREESQRLIREESTKEQERQIFGNAYNARSNYFLTSGDKIRYFFEKGAFNLESKELIVPVEQSLAKIGHALHCLNPTFKQITITEKVKQVFRVTEFEEPTVVQSMVIFKNPKVGGEYTPHQDASFLCTEPIHLAGVWLALDDSTLENGCLQFIPGSHKWPLARRFLRVKNQGQNKVEAENEETVFLDWTSPPVEYDDNQFIHVPVKRGSLVMIHGLVVHRSAANNSEKARWIYTFHVYDRNRATYLKDNWLQMIDNDTFMPIYRV